VSVVADSDALSVRTRDPLACVDDRTFQLIERRRRASRPVRRGWLMRRMLLAADLVGITLAFAIASLADHPGAGQDHVNRAHEFVLFLAVLPLWVVLAKLYGLYERDEERADHSTTDDLFGVFHLVTVGVWLFFLGARATGFADPPLHRLVLLWALAVMFVTTARGVARTICRRGTAYLQNTLIVGAGDVGQTVARKILGHHEYGLNVVGFVDAMPKERGPGLEHLSILGSPEEMPRLIELLDVERVIIAFSNDRSEDILAIVRSVEDMDVRIDVVPRLFEIVGSNVSLHNVEGLALVGLPPLRLSRSSRLMKRAVDVTLSTIGLVLLAPVFAVVALAIKVDSRGPVFFRQTRMGADEKTFRIFKFRTMRVDAETIKHELAHLNMHAADGGDPRMFKIPNDPRVTRIGSFLRRSRIDELPQLLNVLAGEMSLVGPRPLILEEDQHIVEWGRKRLNLRPGITGLWQALGASDIPFDEMVKLDYLYVTNWSMSEDFRLISRTVTSIVRPRRAF
jgi:exopolysaccharide biosynthesis polyprenyl glycosylphosphotransferase